MNIMKKEIIALTIINVLAFVFVFFSLRTEVPRPNAVVLNDVVQTIGNNETDNLALLTDALANAFWEMDAARFERDERVRGAFLLFLVVMNFASALFFVQIRRKILEPFRKLQTFAWRVAEGALDVPLEMDRHNTFGAFTESFDIMREELKKANESKKELIASLSHDIKTPIASIKAVTELMLLKTTDEKEAARLHSIANKAEQVNALITNMFNASLEELLVLNVNPVEMSSTDIKGLIQSADYDNRVSPFEIPSCLVIADALRLQQVFDNIISNAYKYAGTDMTVASYYEGDFLVIELRDYGHGVPEADLPTIFDKFKRGQNAIGAGGQGLGLYIARYFMTQMSGDIYGENKNGLVIYVKIKLAE